MNRKTLMDLGSSWYQWFAAHLKSHRPQLLLALSASLVGQAFTLTQTPLAQQFPDSATYLSPARHILSSFQFFDPIRPPGYPFFLALTLLIHGGATDPTTIVLAQAALMILSAGEIYLLAYRLTRNKWTAAVASALFGSNLAIVQWERAILSESFACWLTITIFVLFEAQLRAPKTWKIVSLGILLGLAILVSPADLILPPVILGIALARDLRLGRLRHTWRSLGTAIMLVAGIVAGYIQMNGSATGLYALTDVTNVNLLGKVLEYRMQDENTNPYFTPLRQALDVYVQTQQGQTVIDPYGFLDTNTSFNAPYLNPIGDYSSAIISRHLGEYLVKSIPDIEQTWQIDPTPYVPASPSNSMTQTLFTLATIELWSYILLPFLCIVFLVWFFLRPRNHSMALLCAMTATLAANICLTATGSYGDFYRLRSPLDWAMVLVGGIALVELGRSVRSGYLTFLWTGQATPSPAFSINTRLQDLAAVLRLNKRALLVLLGGLLVFFGIFALIVLLTP